MSIPGFQEIMVPVLSLIYDEKEHAVVDLEESLARHFDLTPIEREELLGSGRQSRFANRVGWSLTHLGKAGLLERPVRGKVRITELGRAIVDEGYQSLDKGFLSSRSEEYRVFRAGNLLEGAKQESKTGKGVGAGNDQEGLSPYELMESSFGVAQRLLAEELIERIKSMSPAFFERLVVEVLVAMGYGGSRRDAGQAVGRSGDGGVDGLIKEDPLGLDVVYIQAKRWEGPVGRPTVQEFAGSLDGFRARKGVLITTSRFSDGAIDFARSIEKRIVLIDGPTLAGYMIEHGVAMVEVANYRVQKVDEEYFVAD